MSHHHVNVKRIDHNLRYWTLGEAYINRHGSKLPEWTSEMDISYMFMCPGVRFVPFGKTR